MAMKILHVPIRLVEADGGPPHVLVTLAKAQAALGDEITILPGTCMGGKPLIDHGRYGRLTVLESPTDSNLKFPDKLLKKSLLELIKDFDIVHIHGSWRYHLVAASHAARRYGIPYIVRPAGSLGSMPRSYKAYIKKPYFYIVERPILKKAVAIHCCSMKESDEIRELNIGTNIFILPNPVEDMTIYSGNPQEIVRHLCPELRPDDFVILYLGRIAWIKQLSILLDAFARISRESNNVKLILAGPWEDQNLLAFLQSRIAHEQLNDKVYMPGMVQGNIKAAFLRRATVFAQPSIHENFGLSVAEALSFGKPCVINNGVALADEVEHTGAGIKYYGSCKDLAKALHKVIFDTKFRSSCEEAAKRIATKFKSQTIARKLREEYNQLINER